LYKVPKTQTSGIKVLIHMKSSIGANDGFEHACCKTEGALRTGVVLKRKAELNCTFE